MVENLIILKKLGGDSMIVIIQVNINNRIMKRILFSFFILIPSFCFAQNNVFDESLIVLNKLNEGLSGRIASFLEFPETHRNTIKVYDGILEIKNVLKDQEFDPATYKNPQAIWSNPKVQQYYNLVDKMRLYADIFEELLRNFKGYNSAGLSQNQMSLLDPLFRMCGWKITLLNVDCKDAYFYEYQLKGCKMLFIKNTLPPADYNNAIFNNIEVDFTYDYYGTGGKWYVGGGKYRMIQFQDDENSQYYSIIKASSERK